MELPIQRAFRLALMWVSPFFHRWEFLQTVSDSKNKSSTVQKNFIPIHTYLLTGNKQHNCAKEQTVYRNAYPTH